MSEVAKQMVCKASIPQPLPVVEAAPTAALRRTLEKREHRFAIYQELTSLLTSGVTQSEASRQLGIGLRTVQRWLTCGVFAERKHRMFPSIVDPYGRHLEQRYGEGCRNIALLWKELTARGLEGQPCTVRAWLRQRFGSPRKGTTGPRTKRPIPVGHQRIAWLMLKAKPGRNRYLKALYKASPTIAQIAHTARDLFEIIRKRDADAWPAWLEAAGHSPYARFARHLRRDQQAVAAALQLPWSNKMVEGQIHRLKLLKRQMSGRASFDLLKLRVLHSA